MWNTTTIVSQENLILCGRLHKPSPYQVEGLLGGVFADAVAVAAEVLFDGFVFLGVGEGDVDQTDGLLFAAAGGAGDAGNSQS